MDFFYFLLFMGAGFLVYWVIGRGVHRGAAVVTGAVTGNTRARGLAAVHLEHKFSLPVDGRNLVDRLIETLELGPAWRDSLMIDDLDDDRSSMAIAIGGRSPETAKFFVTTEATESGCSGSAGVVSWREVEGRITAAEQIERIHKHLRSAVSHLGGTVSEHESK